jgi:hypothetical protein
MLAGFPDLAAVAHLAAAAGGAARIEGLQLGQSQRGADTA